MKLKVVSDGSCFGTKVTNAETGEMLEGIQTLKYECGFHNYVDGLTNVWHPGKLTLEVLIDDCHLECDKGEIKVNYPQYKNIG